MSTSQFCIQQRQQEQQQVRKLLWVGLACSIALHGILAAALPRQLRTKAPQVKKPMELILVDKPKPKPKIKETPILPKPKPEPPQQKAPEPKPEPPKPEPKPEPPQQKAPEPKSEPPKPEPKPEIPQPKAPTPQKILTSNLPPISQAPVAPQPQPQQAIAPSPVKKSSPNVATNSPPPTTESESTESASEEEGIACVSNCEPEYPDALEGAEGSAGVKLTIDPKGNVISAELASADSNSQVNRQALLAARQMEFSSPPGGNAASVQVKIDFTVEGSDYDRARREEQEKKEQAAKEQQEQEIARQQQLKLKQERQARQQQQQSIPNTQPGSKPLPALDQSELEAEKLRKFRERIENY
jgi:TonB family protein